MSGTRSTVLGGSPTARIQEETKALTSAGEIIHDAATGNTAGLFSRFLRGLGYGDLSPETLDELSKLLLTNPNQQTAQRLTQMAARPPPGPITPTTQATTGAIGAAMTGMVLGRSTNETPRPPLRTAARPPRPTRQQLLVRELQSGALPAPLSARPAPSVDRRRQLFAAMLEENRRTQGQNR